MQMDAIYQPWLACGDDTNRPMLNYCKVERLPWAVSAKPAADAGTYTQPGVIIATSNWASVMVPVQLEPEEEVGLVHKSALMQAARLHQALGKRHPLHDIITLYLRGDIVQLMGIQLDRWIEPGDGEGKFPDLWPFYVAPCPEKDQSNGNLILLNPKLYTDVCKAVGCEATQSHVVRPVILHQAAPKQPLVWAKGWTTDTPSRPIAPAVAIMPLFPDGH